MSLLNEQKKEIDGKEEARKILEKIHHKTRHSGTSGEEVHINNLLHDVLIIKAESLNSPTIHSYASYLEKQLMAIKNGDKVLKL